MSAPRHGARSYQQVKRAKERTMRGVVKLLLTLGLTAALSACVVAPPGRAYVRVGVVAPAPVLVYHGGYYYRHW